MKILFVIDRFDPFEDASAKVLNNLLSSKVFSKNEIHVLSKGNKLTSKEENIHIHHFAYKESLIFKTIKKINNKKYVKNIRYIAAVNKNIKIICDKYGIKRIVFVIGNFDLLYCNKSSLVKTDYIFYDEFTNCSFYKKTKLKHLLNIQKQAFEKAAHIFVLEEYMALYNHFFPELFSKFKVFYITAFYETTENTIKSGNYFVHSGAFFEGLREPYAFLDFFNFAQEHNVDISAISLGFLPKSMRKINVPSNVLFTNRKFGQEYEDLICNAAALVLVDNCDSCAQIPSKVYEYIGLDKKIIFFTSGITNTARLLAFNKNVFWITSSINDRVLSDFLLFMNKPVSEQRFLYFKNERDYVAKLFMEEIYSENC